MTKTISPVFKARDDSEWPTAKQAEKRNKIVAAKRKFAEARDDVIRYVKEAALTADGQPFAGEDSTCDFWWVARYWVGELPLLRRVTIFAYHVTIDEDRADGGLVVREYRATDRGGSDYQTYPLKELYASKKAAEAAHLAACEERLKEITGKVEELRKDYGRH